MNPQEEYIRRHGLICPLIKRPTRRYYVLSRAPRQVASSGWLIMHVELVCPNHKPPYYQVKWYQPTHSSQGGQMSAVLLDEQIQWDEYESYMIRKMQEYPSILPLAGEKPVQLGLWEILIFTCDEYLHSIPFGTQQLIWKTIDPDLSEEERINAQTKCIQLLRTNPQIYSRWESLRPFIDSSCYANWFADIFEKVKEESYRQQFCERLN